MNVHLPSVYQSKLNTLVKNYIDKLSNSSYGEAYTSMIIQLDLLNIYDSRYIYKAVTGIIKNDVPHNDIINKDTLYFFTDYDMNVKPHSLISYQKYQIWKMLFTFHSKSIKCFNNRKLNYMGLCILHHVNNGHVINFGFYKNKFFLADIQGDTYFSDSNLNNIVTKILDKYGNIDKMELLTRIPRTKTFAKKNKISTQGNQILILIRPMVRPKSLSPKLITYLNKTVARLYVLPSTTISELKILVSNHPHILNLKAVLIQGNTKMYDDSYTIKDTDEYRNLTKRGSSYITLYAGIIKETDTPEITFIPKIKNPYIYYIFTLL